MGQYPWKVSHRAAYNAWRRDYRQVIRYAVHWYKLAHPCADCGTTDPHVLTFDHVRGQKAFTIGGPNGDSLHRVWLEIQKCEVVCFNCHMIRTRSRLVITSRPVMSQRIQRPHSHM
ncbi:hypothetical protein LCGC14_2082280 [marine sediment metagenome]|uniref:HNH domain-containing protein n=1 Tax=marine sediment metagenome TaxID=412755 RepID=A0A0F9EFF7_9ZZZZ